MPQSGPTTPRPISNVPLRLGMIPKKLKKFNRWILWKYTQLPTGKWTKTPHSALDGMKIDATDFTNGLSFTEAVQSLKNTRPRFDGLGFMLGAGIAGIDVDDCIDDDGNLDARGEQVSAAYRDTYAEVSPSGRGFKILVDIGDDSKLAVIGKNSGDMEIYGGKRYFTVTGALLPNHANDITPMAQAFEATALQMGANRLQPAPMPTGHPKDGLGIDMKAARELLDHLPFTWCDLYIDWVKAGMALHHEFNGDPEALALWDEWSQRSPKYDSGACEAKWRTFGRPGKDDVTLRTLVWDAQSTGWRAPPRMAQAMQDFTVWGEPPVPTVDDEGVLSGPSTWWDKYGSAELLTTAAPVKEWIWNGVLRTGKLMVLAGSGGSSKSYLMLAAAMQYALGNSWGPFESASNKPGKVMLVYGEEDKGDVHDRIQALRYSFMLTDEHIEIIGKHMAVLPMRGKTIELAHKIERTNDVEITQQMEDLEARVVSENIQLIVLDPMALLHSLDENDNHGIAAFISGLDAVCMRTNCSIVLVHHFGKGGPVRANEINENNLRGASALAAHARTVVVMHRLREDEAAEWGVPTEEHNRWVMWTIAKNNYGPSGRRAWFNVDGRTGAVTPAPTELVQRSPLDLRAILLEQQRAARDEHAADEITETEARKARDQELHTIELTGCMRILLRVAEAKGLCTNRDAPDVVTAAGMIANKARAKEAWTLIRNQLQLVDSDGLVNADGRKWLADREMLE